MAKRKTPDAPKRSQRMLTVSETRYAALEAIATKRRRSSGDLVAWQDVANEAIDKFTS